MPASLDISSLQQQLHQLQAQVTILSEKNIPQQPPSPFAHPRQNENVHNPTINVQSINNLPSIADGNMTSNSCTNTTDPITAANNFYQGEDNNIPNNMTTILPSGYNQNNSSMLLCNFNNNVTQFNINANPFTPPPIPSSIMKKIYKDEYVDFEDMLPPTPVQMLDDQNIQIEMASTGFLQLKKKHKVVRINDFPSWVTAWKAFFQASLCKDQSKCHQVFSYFKNFSQLDRKYRFDVCLIYDKAHRTILAAQAMLPANQQTTFWQKNNEELVTSILTGALLPSCYTFHSTGHYASSCPLNTQTPRNPPMFRNVYNQSFRQPSPYYYTAHTQTSNNITRPHMPTPQPTPINNPSSTCNRFNHNSICRLPCRFPHICNRCFKPGHAGIECRAKSNNTINPQM